VIRVRDLAAFASLGPRAFEQQFGEFVLVRQPNLSATHPRPFSKTMVATGKAGDTWGPLGENLAAMEIVASVSRAAQNEYVLGRSAGADFIVREQSVSSRHAAFSRAQYGWALRDLGSTNGTTLNGATVTSQPVVLMSNDRLSFGDSVFLFFTTAGLYEDLHGVQSAPP
jgi:hypothetical protein